MSPLVYVLCISTWLSHLTVHLHPSDWGSPLPIPSPPASIEEAANRVLIEPRPNELLQTKNRAVFEKKLVKIAKREASSQEFPSQNKDNKTHTHYAYCTNYIKSVYANCGVWIPSLSWSGMQTFGITIENRPLRIGDVVFIESFHQPSSTHVGIYVGDGYWVHPGHPDLSGTLASIKVKGFHVKIIKRLVA